MEFVEKEFLPVILGADIGAYSLARSFHEEYSMRSLVVSMLERKFVSQSKIVENRVVPGLENADVLIDALVKIGREFEGKKKLIVMGCGDWYVRNLVENRAALEPYYIVPYCEEELLNRIVLKDHFYEIFEELGLDYPKTYVYECGKENDLKFDFDYPVIAKPASSALYHYAKFEGKKKVFRFNDEKSLREMLGRLEKSGYDYKFLIQDTIPGPDSCMRVLTCYCDHVEHKVRFASLGRTLLEDHTPGAIGNPVAIVNEVNPDIVAAAAKFLEHIKYSGFANFDVKYDSRDGRYKFFEINTRLGRSNFYVTGSGFNTVKWIVNDYVYGKNEPYTVADNVNLFTVVPKGVIMKYVDDPELKKQAAELWKAGKVTMPLFYKPDNSPGHVLDAEASYVNQYRKFAKYF
ncbi:MAG: hypothetical protein K6C36_04505 [Clostridia bacterium]|nr:hypothetical protein [Clostridia bacterium]